MAYRKKTLRSMSPVTRKIARLIGEQDSIARRFKNLIPEIQRLEMDSRALITSKQEPRLNCQGLNCKREAVQLYGVEFGAPNTEAEHTTAYLCKRCAQTNNIPVGRVYII